MTEHYDLNEIPWTDVAASIKAGNDTIMIPVGSMEKHGHHVPLGVDSYTTMGSVEYAAKKAKVLYTPLLPFGVSRKDMTALASLSRFSRDVTMNSCPLMPLRSNFVISPTSAS